MLEQILGDSKHELIKTITSKLGVSDAQAGGFLGSLLERLEDLLKGGKLDVQQLLSGDLGAITKNLNLDALGGLLGGGADKGEQGVKAVMGSVTDKLGGSEDLLGQLEGLLGGDGKSGGGLDALKGIAGKFLGG
ncbi:MAG: hypothetical protein R3B49_09050 [Phycisphaerales bacterium]